MADPAESPRSKLEFLYRDVLGEVADLVGRLEAASADLTAVARARPGDATAEALARAAGASASKVRTELERAAESACRQLSSAVLEAAREAREIQRARQRDHMLLGTVCLGASLLGGAVVAALLRVP